MSTEPQSQNTSTTEEWLFRFNGNAKEYFKIWIVNVFLTIITFSLYAPWAKVRRMRYFYGNTTLGDWEFDFTAEPKRILIGRLIAMTLFMVSSFVSELNYQYSLLSTVLLFAIMPWLIRSSMRFRARNTKFGNTRFAFSGSLGGIYWLFLKCALITLVSLGLAYPIAVYWFKSYYINNIKVGDLNFKLNARARDFYIAALKGYGCMMLGSLILLFLGAALGNLFDTLVALIPFLYLIILGYFLPLAQGFIIKTTLDYIQIGNSDLQNTFTPIKYAWIKFSNYFMTLITLGFMHPWAMIRAYQYQAESMSVIINDNPNELINQLQDNPNSIGEEIADVFDIDISL